MLIEQNAEFESRVPGPLAVHIFLKLLILMTKQKSPRQVFELIFLMLKPLQKAACLVFPDLGEVTNFNLKMHDLNLVWT